MKRDKMIKVLEKELDSLNRDYNKASFIGYKLFQLLLGFEKNKRTEVLVDSFLKYLSTMEMDNLLEWQMEYAIKIADFDGSLEYEEMHKLFSLCDEIFALEYLGLSADSNLKIDFYISLKNRFKKEKKKFKMVSEDKIEDWKKEFWWYKW